MNIWKNKKTRAWLITSSILVALFLVINILAQTVFFDIICVITNMNRRMELVGGNENQSVRAYTNLEGATTKETAKAHGDEVTLKTCEEGFTLLKNNNNVLPLKAGAKISVFGKNSSDMAMSGSGSSGSISGAKSIFDSLESAGYSYNKKLKEFYDSSASGAGRDSNPSDLDSGKAVTLGTGETPLASYGEDVWNSCNEYKDLAIVVITRIGGEGFDLPRSYMQLDENEKALIGKVKEMGFGGVMVVLNTGNTIEINSLKNDDGVNAIMWVGYPGENGMMAFGELLKGDKVTPSGRTTDTYATMESNPAWNNAGSELGTIQAGSGVISGDSYYTGTEKKPRDSMVYFVDYEETIYVGYRYYETAYAVAPEGFDYDSVVAYPFGYGLSYTTFSWEIKNKSHLPAGLSSDTSMTVEVEVTNTGSYAARDVVQLYVTPPYTANGIEKSSKVLVGFAKTDVLEPGHKQTVSITVDSPYSYASYDCYDANANGFKGYEVEKGDYTFVVAKNVHEADESLTFTANVAQDIRYEKDPSTETAVVNLYTDNEDATLNSDTELGSKLSRADFVGTWPKTRENSEKKRDTDFVNQMKSTDPNPNNTDVLNATMPKTETDDDCIEYTYKDENGNEQQGKRSVEFKDVVGLPYNDPLWEKFLDRLSVKEMTDLFNQGGFKTAPVERLGVPETLNSDGINGWVNFLPGISAKFEGTCKYCNAELFAATWNVDRLYEYGESVGNEGLIGSNGTPYTGWYAPGVNTHRNPMGGRNFEYYSEDPFLSGQLCASLMKGAASMGVYVNVKHFALNDQETHRSVNGLLTWATEQSMREIYLKAFEVAVKTAKADYTLKADGERVSGGEVVAMGVMSSFNRIGQRWAGGDYRLLTKILRNEWGFRGLVICDFNTCSHMVEKDMCYAGGDLNLQIAGTKVWSPNASSAQDVTVLRQAAKNILFTVANSNAYRGEFTLHMPVWQIILIVVDCVLFAGLAVWGVLVIVNESKKEKNNR